MQTFHPRLQDRRAFVRDAVACALSVLALLAVMLRGTFSALEACLLLGGYCAYLAVCIVTSRAGGAGGAGGGHRHAYFAVTPSQEQLQLAEQQALVGGSAAAAAAVSGGLAEAGEAFAVSTGMQLPRQLSGVVVAGGAALPGQQAVELVSRGGSTTPQRKSAAQLAGLEGGNRPASPLPFRGKPLGEAAAAVGGGQEELASLVGGVPPSDGGTSMALTGPSPRGGAGTGWRPKLAAGHSSRMGKLVHSATRSLEELLRLHGKSGPRLWLSVAMAPARLLLHATMPALHPGAGAWGVCKSVCESARLAVWARAAAAAHFGLHCTFWPSSAALAACHSRHFIPFPFPPFPPCRVLHARICLRALPGRTPVCAAGH